MAAFSSREFNQYTGRAKTLAKKEPVFITERGTVKYVLLNINDYENLMYPNRSNVTGNPFAMSETDYFDFEIPRAEWGLREVGFE